MAMDGLSLRAMLYELQPLVGGKIDKVQQPDCDALLVTVRAAGSAKKLYVSCHPQNGRVQATELAYLSPDMAPAYCMLLRKKLVGGRIESIEQTGMDRIATLTIISRDELFDEARYRLVVELTGKYSNIVLVGPDGAILDAIKRVGLGASSVRAVLPGFCYENPPAQDKLDAFALDRGALTGLIATAERPDAFLSDRFLGLSKAAARALAADETQPGRIADRLLALSDGPYEATLVRNALSEPVGVFPFFVEGGERMGTLSAAYDAFYEEKDRIVRVQRNSQTLRRAVENHLGRAINKLAVYNEAIEGEEAHEKLRLYGELITANLYRLRRGLSVAALENYYVDPPAAVPVALDPLLTPQENAQRYFKRYRKSRTAREYALSRRDGLLMEIGYLEGQLDNIEKCGDARELAEIRDEMIALRYMKADSGAKKRQKSPPTKPMQFLAADGTRIYVGKNNRQNDELTLHKAAPENYFVHVKNSPGSHVIVDCAGEPSRETLYAACQLAAWYSKSRASSNVPVDYTPRRFVKKPAGARPGMVVYTTYHTAFITPDPTAIAGYHRID